MEAVGRLEVRDVLHGVGHVDDPGLDLDAWRERMKQALDPENVLGCGNG